MKLHWESWIVDDTIRTFYLLFMQVSFLYFACLNETRTYNIKMFCFLILLGPFTQHQKISNSILQSSGFYTLLISVGEERVKLLNNGWNTY